MIRMSEHRAVNIYAHIGSRCGQVVPLFSAQRQRCAPSQVASTKKFEQYSGESRAIDWARLQHKVVPCLFIHCYDSSAW